jgi:type VI protein secretion system component VasF
MSDIDETVSEAVERATEARDALNSLIAVLVALLATFMALCNIKDGNIVQAMSQDQAKAVDQWSYYQAKGMKQNLAESVLDQLQIRKAQPGLAPQEAALLDKEISIYAATVKKYEGQKEEIKKTAEAAEKDYDRLNVHDDQFDMSEAAVSISIALLGVSALTRKRWLVGVAVLFAAFGVVLGLAGFFGWGIHPDAIARFLT